MNRDRVPRRPSQGLYTNLYSFIDGNYFVGVFPFNFDRDEAEFGVPEEQPVDATQPLPLQVDEEDVQPPSHERNGQLSLRRSGRQRRTNIHLRGYGEIC